MTDILDCITPLATLALAGATGWMAWKTAALVKQAQKHHVENLTPVLTLDPIAGICLHRSSSVDTDARYLFNGILRNSGLGPALDLKAIIRFPGIGEGKPKHLPPLGGGMEWGETTTGAGMVRGQIFFLFPHQGNLPSESSGVVTSTWEIDLEYSDVFGNKYWTKHVCEPGHSEKPWFTFQKVRK